MESFSEVVKALSDSPAAAIAAMALGGVGFLWKQLRDEQAAHLATVKENGEAQREDLKQVLPLAEKLAEAVETLERYAMNHLKGGS